MSAFDFPKDTIVPAGSTVSFASSVTKLAPQSKAEVSIIKQSDAIPAPRAIAPAPAPAPATDTARDAAKNTERQRRA